MNSVDAKTENVSLTQVISKYFFASFLPDSQEVVDELYENLHDGYFNLASLLTTKNKETKEFLNPARMLCDAGRILAEEK